MAVPKSVITDAELDVLKVLWVDDLLTALHEVRLRESPRGGLLVALQIPRHFALHGRRAESHGARDLELAVLDEECLRGARADVDDQAVGILFEHAAGMGDVEERGHTHVEVQRVHARELQAVQTGLQDVLHACDHQQAGALAGDARLDEVEDHVLDGGAVQVGFELELDDLRDLVVAAEGAGELAQDALLGGQGDADRVPGRLGGGQGAASLFEVA